MKDKTPYFEGRALFNGIGISYLFLLSSSSFWISALIGTFLGLLIIYLYKIVPSKFSTFLSNIIISVITLSVLVNIGHSLYLKNTPIWILTLFPIVSISIASSSKIKGLQNVTHYLFIYSLFIFALAVFGLLPHVDMNNLMPQNIVGTNDIILSTLIYALSGVIPILSNENVNIQKREIITSYLLSSITIITMCFFSISILGIKEAIFYRYPEYVVLKRIEFLNFISNVDSIFNFAIIVDILITSSRCIKNVEKSSSSFVKNISIIIISIIVLLVCYYNKPILLIYEYYPYILVTLMLILLIPKNECIKQKSIA